MNFSNRAHADARRWPVDINLTSLVDIIFNLLLFFMLTSSIAEHPGIDLDLPKASSADSVINEKDVTLILADDGSIQFNHEAVAISDIAQKLSGLKSSSTRVVLKADQDVSHGQVVKIIDLVRAQGIKTISIATMNQPS